MKPRYSPALALVASLLMTACAKQEAAAPVAATPSVPAAAPTPAGPTGVPTEGRYPLTGEIIKVEAEQQALIVTHDEIKGYMPAMTMEFKVSKADLANAKPGQRIRAEMVDRGKDYWLEKIWPADTVTATALAASANALAQDTAVRGKEAYREIGESLPTFTLLDQEGRTVSASRCSRN